MYKPLFNKLSANNHHSWEWKRKVIPVKFLITQQMISTHFYVSATIGSFLQAADGE